MKKLLIVVIGAFLLYGCVTVETYERMRKETVRLKKRVIALQREIDSITEQKENNENKQITEQTEEVSDLPRKGPLQLQNEFYSYYLNSGVTEDEFTGTISAHVTLIAVQKKNIIRDIYNILLSYSRITRKNRDPFGAVSIRIMSKEWFFLEDYFVIKINNELIRLEGNTDSSGGLNYLTTYFSCILSADQEAAIPFIKEDIRSRIYTKERNIDFIIPKEFFIEVSQFLQAEEKLKTRGT